MNLGIKGVYDFVLNEGTSRETTVPVDNMILNNFLVWLKAHSLGGNSFHNLAKQLRIGSDDSPTTPAQVALVAGSSSKTVTQEIYSPITTDGTTWSCSVTFIAQYALGEFIGTVREVGFGISNNTSQYGIVYSRAVLNNPITVTEEDQLTIKYTLNLSCSDLDSVSSINLNNVDYIVLARRASPELSRPFAAFMNQASQLLIRTGNATLGAAGVSSSGGSNAIAGNIAGIDGYVDGQKIVRLTIESTQANDALGIKVIEWANIYKFEFTPPLAKTSNNKITLDFSFTFGRG